MRPCLQAAAAAVGYPSPDGGVVAADAPVVRRELPVGQHAVADAIQIAFPAVVHIEVCKPSGEPFSTYQEYRSPCCSQQALSSAIIPAEAQSKLTQAWPRNPGIREAPLETARA